MKFAPLANGSIEVRDDSEDNTVVGYIADYDDGEEMIPTFQPFHNTIFSLSELLQIAQHISELLH